MNIGAGAGEVPEGRIYIHRMTIITDFPDGYESRQDLEGHVAILDGKPYFFIACSD